MLRALLLLCLAAPAAAQTDPAPPPEPTPEAQRRYVSLYSDLRAHQAGDLLTVVLQERTSARRASASRDETSLGYGGAAGVSPSLGGTFGMDAQFDTASDSDSRTVQSDLLQGTITVQVTSVDPAGNLIVEGERRLDVDGTTHLLSVSGLVRPADVGTNNAVLSHQIAAANVVYKQEGGGMPFLKPKFLTRLGALAVLVGAVVLGSVAASGGGDAPAAVGN